ncbi:MAG: TRAP transporter fused permease subunit, partial [Clostridia bacterium]
MLKYLTKPGLKRELSGTAGTIRDAISISAALYLIFAVLFYPAPILHRSIAFGLFYSVIFMGYSSPGTKSGNRVPVFDWVFAALSLSVSIYIGLNFGRISSRLVFVDRVLTPDIIFGFLTIFLLIEGTRRVMGPWLPGLSLLALAYIFWGHHIQGRFGHLKFNTEYILDGLFLSNYGIWGSTLGIAAGKVMVFLLFGTLFKNTGAGDFLFALVSRITGRVKGGVGKVAVISSALFGMLQGAALTNVTTTGAMTIPAMKRGGFKSEYAACVESCASVGGVFMPPIMGTVAFIMSDVVGIPYADLIKRAVIPAIIYFSALFFSIDFHSRKHGIEGIANETKAKIVPLLLSGYNFFIPLVYLIMRLMSGRPVAKAGLETIGVMLILGLLNRKKPLKFKAIIDTLKTTTSRGVMIVSTMAACGILIGVIDITGITSKFSSYLIYVADVSVIATLVVIMLATLFLGLAMNTSSSYLIAAVLGAPVLIGLGFEPLGVHMFILFFAAMSTITPPVAMTSY